MHPYPDPHSFLFRIIGNLRQVQSGHGPGDGRMRARLIADAIVAIPGNAHISYDGMIFKSIPGAKIDIVLVGLEVDTRSKGSVRDYIAIPPMEIRLTRPDPRYIIDSTGIVKTGEDVRFDQGPGPVANQQCPPGCAVGKVCFYFYGSVRWQGRQFTFEIAIVPYKIHAGIIHQLRFRNCHIDLVGIFHKDGHIHQRIVLNLTKREVGISSFMGTGEPGQKRSQQSRIACQTKTGIFGGQGEAPIINRLPEKYIPECQPIIEDPYQEIDPAPLPGLLFEGYFHLPVKIMYRMALSYDQVVFIFSLPVNGPANDKSFSEITCSLKRQS